MRRRDLLRRSLGAGATLLVPAHLLGCDSEPGMDAGSALDAYLSGLDAGSPADFRGLTKGPFVQLVGSGRARLRFETRIDEPVPVRLERTGGADDPDAVRTPMTLTYEREALGMADRFPDHPGTHVLHEVTIEGLAPGESVAWTVTPEEGDPSAGSFTGPVAPDAAFSFGWVSDTSAPFSADGVAVLAGRSPDLVLHGGDITYQANPYDTWNGMTRSFGPLFARAPMHFTIGNHEFENDDEVHQQYERLLAGQGDVGGSARWFAYTYGGVRFIHLDTETADIVDNGDGQLDWLDAELAAATADPDVRYPVVAYHRPTFTFSKHAPGSTRTRDALHSRFQSHGVPLVFSGHSHAYERFYVDGITYVIDGGGGAALYDPDEDIEDVRSRRPDDIPLRQMVTMSMGVTFTEVAADGTLTLTRLSAADGAEQDRVVLSPPAT